MSDELTSRVLNLVAQALQVAPHTITAETAFGDLPEWDSMGHMEVMLALEEHFGVEIDAESIAALTSIPHILAHLREVSHA